MHFDIGGDRRYIGVVFAANWNGDAAVDLVALEVSDMDSK